MKVKAFILSTILFFGISIQLIAQNTVKNVLDNTVTRCTKVIGIIINVSTVQQLKDAINSANSGGGNVTILIADGTYQIASTSWYPYITASNIVFRSASGNRNSVVICGGGMRDAGGVENGFYFVGNNITVADLTIKNVGNHAISLDGDNLHVYNVRFQNTYEQMLKGTSAGNGADNGIVECCLFEYPAGIGPQYYIGGIDVHMGQDWVVKDNVFKNIKSPSGSVAEHAIHFWNNSSNITVERNLIINCDRGIGFGLGSSACNGGIIRNNMIYNNGSGAYSDVGIGLETCPNTRVYNNTIFLATYQNAIEYRFAATTNVDIKNNLTNKAIASRDGSSGTLTTNVVNAQSVWFVDVQAGNLRLASSISSVVNKGTSLPNYVTDDIDKVARTSGIDIGASEYSPVSGIEEYETLKSSTFNCAPNPFCGNTFIKYQIQNPAKVVLKIYNSFGKQIAVLVDEEKMTGKYEVIFDAGKYGCAPGIYFYRIEAGNLQMTKSMILVK